MGITLFAFENLAVVTIAPLIAADLQGLELYGWVFSGFLLASLLGIVMAGEWADKKGPELPMFLGLLIFAAGLSLSAIASTMLVFILGRVLQGLGGGAMTVALYVAVNLAYPDTLRPRMVALMSSAWVVPALLGPALAGFLAEVFNWRIVFWGMLPLLLVVMLLTATSFRSLRRNLALKQSRTPMALVLVVSTAVFIISLSLGNPWLSLLLVVGSFGIALLSLKSLLPSGVLSLQAGLPSTIATRGLVFAAFIGVEVLLALMLTSVHGVSAAMAGIVIAAGTISWTAGSWLQDRLDKRQSREGRIMIGALLMALASALMLPVLFSSSFVLFFASVVWLLAGLGIGLAHATSSVLAFSLAPQGEEGLVSSALQLGDQFMAAVSAGVAGALLGLATMQGHSEQTGIAWAFIFAVAMGIFSIVAAGRIRSRA